MSGLDTKVNLRVSLHTAITNFMNMKQWQNETNNNHLIKLKSMIGTLKLAGGEEMMGKGDLHSTTKEERNKGKAEVRGNVLHPKE